MIVDKITYFKKSGKGNTEDVLDVVKNKLKAKLINYVVIASSSGKTALSLIEKLKGINTNIIVVGLHAGFRGNDNIAMLEENKIKIINNNAKIFTGSHSLSGVGRSISNKFGGTTPVEIIANTLRLFGGHGLKVAVEISIMAADGGLIPTNENIIAIGGTHGGADTAAVLKAAHMNNFFDLEIKEILAKPL